MSAEVAIAFQVIVSADLDISGNGLLTNFKQPVNLFVSVNLQLCTLLYNPSSHEKLYA
jgi:hypothetical protein